MIPQNFKDILSSTAESNAVQVIAMIIFILLFLGIVFLVFNRPKKYYDKDAMAPLDDDAQDDAFKL